MFNFIPFPFGAIILSRTNFLREAQKSMKSVKTNQFSEGKKNLVRIRKIIKNKKSKVK